MFLSPPVRMHGGALMHRILYVCMSVTWPKFRLEVKSYLRNHTNKRRVVKFGQNMDVDGPKICKQKPPTADIYQLK